MLKLQDFTQRKAAALKASYFKLQTLLLYLCVNSGGSPNVVTDVLHITPLSGTVQDGLDVQVEVLHVRIWWRSQDRCDSATGFSRKHFANACILLSKWRCLGWKPAPTLLQAHDRSHAIGLHEPVPPLGVGERRAS